MTSAIRAVIVDDERPARELVRSMLERWPRVTIVGEAEDGVTAVRMIEAQSPDLVFLDVQMPLKSGFEVLAALGDDPPIVVFVTAYEAHALKAFEVSACDYLLKPFDDARFAVAVERAIVWHDRPRGAWREAVRSVLEAARTAARDQIVVRSGGRHVFLHPDEVDWVEAAGKEVKVHVGKAMLAVREPMSRLEDRLDPLRFVRVHRGAIVNRARIREIVPTETGEHLIVLRDGTRVESGRSYRDAVRGLVGVKV